uniref:class I SAM-dependent methyltransferase n=1 Tax=Methyloglobulus sp. TaxID=2518622 RepID=UPI00398982D8
MKSIMRERNLENHTCPVCEKTDGVFSLCEINGFSLYQCRSCGADHVFPMPDKNTPKNYYDRKDWFEGGEAGGYRNYYEQTTWSLDVLKPILDQFGGQQNLSILDIDCGYGTHLALAAEQGWKCFGVEVSNHARQIAQQRLAGSAYIVESVEDIIPHEFDLVLMLDVIEHLPSPYPLLYSLFSKGAITQKTQLVITTPNAGSDEARTNLAEWSYRHPPSHLVYYSELSLRFLLEKLHFCDVLVQGMYPLEPSHTKIASLGNFGGLLVTTKGSDFTEFMRERYVPGTWSKIAEYEHMPRYELARTLVVGKHVLDFGCGTGYGSAMLAEVAEGVTGLDIDEKAIDWATETHHNLRLRFHRCSDLGAMLPAGSFDVVTCFEMIEHVDYEMQQAVIVSIARMLRQDGTLIISSPNPEVTKLYGANPYHLREMMLQEFQDLLKVHFPYVKIMEQRVRNSVTFDAKTKNNLLLAELKRQNESDDELVPLAYVGICSKQPVEDISSLVYFDDKADPIKDFLVREKKLNLAHFDAYRLAERSNSDVVNEDHEIARLNSEVEDKNFDIARLNSEVEDKNFDIARLNSEVKDKHCAIAQLKGTILAKDEALSAKCGKFLELSQSRWYRLGNTLKMRPMTLHNFSRIVCLSAGLIIPKAFRAKVAPIISKLRQQRLKARQVSLDKIVENSA